MAEDEEVRWPVTALPSSPASSVTNPKTYLIIYFSSYDEIAELSLSMCFVLVLAFDLLLPMP